MIVQGTTITQDLYVLMMEGANVVHGIQWLETLGTIRTNHRELRFEFDQEGKTVTLHGEPHLSEGGISGSGFGRLVGRREVAYFCHMICEPPDHADEIPQKIQGVLNLFVDLLQEPAGLPPARPTDHRITLEPDAKPINVHPYRYAHFQKSEIEKLTWELLSKGLIKPSISPFSSRGTTV